MLSVSVFAWRAVLSGIGAKKAKRVRTTHVPNNVSRLRETGEREPRTQFCGLVLGGGGHEGARVHDGACEAVAVPIHPISNHMTTKKLALRTSGPDTVRQD